MQSKVESFFAAITAMNSFIIAAAAIVPCMVWTNSGLEAEYR